MVEIAELWYSKESNLWNQALERYWEFVRPVNMALEHEMENLVLSMLRDLDEQGWYDFLRDKYFRWKYTAPNRYATTTRSLKQYVDEGNLQELYRIKESLLTFDHRDIEQGLTIANKIRGLGTAGASGLLSLMYPQTFATVDQFAVKIDLIVSCLFHKSKVSYRPYEVSKHSIGRFGYSRQPYLP